MEKYARFKCTIEVIEGRSGNFDLDYYAKVEEGATADMLAKVSTYRSDTKFIINEGVDLNGKNSKAVVNLKLLKR